MIIDSVVAMIIISSSIAIINTIIIIVIMNVVHLYCNAIRAGVWGRGPCALRFFFCKAQAAKAHSERLRNVGLEIEGLRGLSNSNAKRVGAAHMMQQPRSRSVL